MNSRKNSIFLLALTVLMFPACGRQDATIARDRQGQTSSLTGAYSEAQGRWTSCQVTGGNTSELRVLEISGSAVKFTKLSYQDLRCQQPNLFAGTPQATTMSITGLNQGFYSLSVGGGFYLSSRATLEYLGASYSLTYQ